MASGGQSKSAGSSGPTGQAENCPQCGKRLAADQRYCTNCGHRRGEPRVDVDRYLTGEGEVLADGNAGAAAPRQWSPLLAVVVIALLAGMLLVGVLIGKNSSDKNNGTTTTTTTTGTGTATTPTATATTPTTTTPTVTGTVPTTTAPVPAPGATGAKGAIATPPAAGGSKGTGRGK